MSGGFPPTTPTLRARTGALPVVRAQDQALQTFLDSTREVIERLYGLRGDPLERGVTVGDLQDLGLFKATPAVQGGATNPRGGYRGERFTPAALQQALGAIGITSNAIDVGKLAQEVYNSPRFRDLMTGQITDQGVSNADGLTQAMRDEVANAVRSQGDTQAAALRAVDTAIRALVSALTQRVDTVQAAVTIQAGPDYAELDEKNRLRSLMNRLLLGVE